MGLVGLDSIWKRIELNWIFIEFLAHVKIAPRRILSLSGEQSIGAYVGDPL